MHPNTLLWRSGNIGYNTCHYGPGSVVISVQLKTPTNIQIVLNGVLTKWTLISVIYMVITRHMEIALESKSNINYFQLLKQFRLKF